MINVFRGLAILIGVYTLYLFRSGFSAGMVPVWLCIFGFSIVMSIRKSYDVLMGALWFKGLLTLGVLIVGIILLVILHTGHKNDLNTKADVIIVLGAKVNPQGMSLTLKKRADKAYDYLMKYPEVIAVLSGGRGPDEPMSEGQALYDYLVKKGINDNRLLIEENSTNTRENIEFSYDVLRETYGESYLDTIDVMVVSSRFHLYRAIMIAKNSGVTVSGLGCNTLQILEPNYYLRETIAVFYQFFVDL